MLLRDDNYAAEPRSATRIEVSRQTKSLPSQLVNHNTGRSKSRTNQAAGETQERCQPAAPASSASAPYQPAANARSEEMNGQSYVQASTPNAVSGKTPPARSSGRKYQTN